ncbi:SGNH hydrolase [Hypoxylon sp. FL1284]|nr:SGNH hydrolase [Hypoxylon sp. FL1284]
MALRIANLGSSFASGPTLAPVIDKAAGRSGANYAHLLAEKLGAGVLLTDLSVSGATLPNLTTDPQDANGIVFAPQVDGVPADADVVLVLGGGNDIGYIGGIIADALNSSWLGALALRFAGTAGAPLATADLDVGALADLYGSVLDAVHAQAPRARVLVVEYVAVLGPDTRPGGGDVPFGADRIAHHLAVRDRLLAATSRAVSDRAPWCSLVSVDAPSRAHAVGSSDPWVSGFSWKLYNAGGVYHPRTEGMRAVADIVYARMVELGIVKNGDKKP